MQYQKGTLEVRLNSHIKDYDFHSLYEVDKVCAMAAAICDALKLEMLLTDRKGKTVYLCGNMAENPDVDKDAGIKIRVYDRTIAHLYVNYADSIAEKEKAEAEKLKPVELSWDTMDKNETGDNALDQAAITFNNNNGFILKPEGGRTQGKTEREYCGKVLNFKNNTNQTLVIPEGTKVYKIKRNGAQIT